jgi:hypothetical protein
MPPADSPSTLRFGEFALDVAAYQLRRDGRPVKLGRQPMDLLMLLVERHGQLVTRADIVARCGARRLRGRRDGRQHRDQQGAPGAPDAPGRAALRGDGGGQGVSLHRLRSTAGRMPRRLRDRPTPSRFRRRFAAPEPAAPRRPPALAAVAAVVALLAVVVIGILAVWRLRTAEPPASLALAVLPFANLGHDADREYLAAGPHR